MNETSREELQSQLEDFAHAHLSRRAVLGGAGAVGAATMLGAGALPALEELSHG